MTKSVTKVQDKDTNKRLSVVRSTADPTKYGVVILNPDGSRISGPKGDPGDAATITVGTTSTGQPGTSASVTNSGTTSAAVLNFTIPRGEQGDTGDTGNGISSVTSSKSGKVTTVTMNFTDAGSTPFSFTVSDGADGEGSGDVIGPASSTDGDVVLFDGATGKIIKDSGVNLSSKLDASALSDNNYGGAWENDSTHTPTKRVLYDKIHTMDVEIGNKAADNTVVKLTGNQTISGTKTFGTSPVVPSKTTDATNTGTAIATEAQVYNVAEDVATINSKIPSAATSSNQLADKDYVNDGINSVTAYYITKNAQGDQWATYAELAAATTFYSGGVVRVPTKNDYTIVLADENHDNATTRYIYNSGWEYQYTVNETALTQAQLDALNSGITSGKVSTYDGYASTISGKQDALTLPATPTSGHLVTWGANNKTLADGGAIPAIEYVTQAEYTALLPGAESDGKHYFIYHTTGGGGGWQPGANTLAYYPFDTDILDHSSNSRALTGDTGTKGTIGYTFTSNVKILNADLPSNVKFINFRCKFNSASGNQGVIVAGGLQQLCMSYYAFGRNQGSPSGLDNVITAFIGSGWSARSHAGPSDIYSWHNICLGYDGSDTMCAIDGVRYSLNSGLDPSAVTDELYLLLVDAGMAGSVELADFIVESQGWTSQEISDYYDNTKSKFGIS